MSMESSNETFPSSIALHIKEVVKTSVREPSSYV